MFFEGVWELWFGVLVSRPETENMCLDCTGVVRLHMRPSGRIESFEFLSYFFDDLKGLEPGIDY